MDNCDKLDNRYRNVCFTCWDVRVWDLLKSVDCKFLIMAKELGENGYNLNSDLKGQKWHIQGYIEFKYAWRLSKIKKIHNEMHIEKRMGTAKQARDYCIKEVSDNINVIVKHNTDYSQDDARKFLLYEGGTISKQGQRVDLESVCRAVKAKQPTDKIADISPTLFVKHHKGIDAYKKALYSDRTEKPKVFWLYGASGKGKTRFPVTIKRSLNGHLPQKSSIIMVFSWL